MNFANLFNKLRKADSIWQPSDYLLHKVIKIPDGLTIVKSTPNGGNTALGLSLLEELSRNNTVLYFDFIDSLNLQRMVGLTTENIIVCKPTHSEQIVKIISNFRKERPIVFLDNLPILQDGWDFMKHSGHFIQQIGDKASKIIVLTRKQVKSMDTSAFIQIKCKEFTYAPTGEFLKTGHYVEITQDNESIVHFIDYTYGRLSPGYAQASRLKEEENLHTSAVYELDGLKVHGFYKFAQAYDEKVLKRNV